MKFINWTNYFIICYSAKRKAHRHRYSHPISHYSKSIAIDACVWCWFRCSGLDLAPLFSPSFYFFEQIPGPVGATGRLGIRIFLLRVDLVKRALYSIASFQTDLERRDERRLPTSVHTFCVQCFDTSLPLREDAFRGHCRSPSIFFER